MFTYTYETRYGDYKDFETIKAGTILDIVQDIAIKDSDECGYGLDVLKDMNLAWLLQGINLTFLNPVKTGIDIEVSTCVKTLRGATSQRCCFIKQGGEVVAKTVANWFMFDTAAGRIAKVPADMPEKFKNYEFDDEDLEFKKPPIFDDAEVKYYIKVANKEIDTNMHLNNQKGADLLMDALPFDFSFKRAKILYKKPAYLGDELSVAVKETENGYYVHLENQDKEICVVGTFEK